MKGKNLLTICVASIAMILTACGGTKTSSNDESSIAPSSSEISSVTPESSSSSSSLKPSSSSSSKANSSLNSSTKPSSSSHTSSAATSSSHAENHEGDKDYKIFDYAPEIRFNTASNLDFATKPGKDTEKPEVTGKFNITGCPAKYALTDAPGTMKVRGNYTSNYQKKPFRLKFESKVNLFGLNEGQKYKKWVLLADVKDPAMLRNSLMFYLARNIFDENLFASDFTPVHLYLNDTYWGLYLLGEQKEVKSGRVNVAEPKAGETNTGYFFELDHYYKGEGTTGDPTFSVTYSPDRINWYHPGENMNERNGSAKDRVECGYTLSSDILDKNTQLPYIKNRVEMAYTVIYDAVMNNKFHEVVNEKLVDSTETDIAKVIGKQINIDSFVDMYILNEIACDPDIGYSSFYLSLDASEKGDNLLTCNCPWDWDSSLGVRAGTVENSTGLYANKSSNMWLSLMTKAPFFMELVKQKWAEMTKANIFNKSLEMIDDYTKTYDADYNQNFDKWPRTMGDNPETTFEIRDVVKKFKNHKEAVSSLRSWVEARYKYLDSQFGENGTYTPEISPEQFKATATPTRYEAENAVLSSDGQRVKEVSGENISGGKYIGDLDGHPGATMTFTVNSNKATKALITAGLSARTFATSFGNMFEMTVNGMVADLLNTEIPAGTNGRDYHFWTTTDVAFVDLKQGANTVVLKLVNSGTNFDYLDVYIPNN